MPLRIRRGRAPGGAGSSGGLGSGRGAAVATSLGFACRLSGRRAPGSAGARAHVRRQDSPRGALMELQPALAATGDGVPAWLGSIRDDLAVFTDRLTDELRRALDRLDALGKRVEDALRRLDAAGPPVPDGAAA